MSGDGPSASAGPPAAPPPSRAWARPRTWSLRTWLLLSVPPACALALTAALLAPGPTDAGGAELLLPASVAGLPVRDGGASNETTDALAERLRRDPAVAGVAVGAYDGDGVSVVVLRLSPARPFDEQTAGRLTAEVLGRTGAGAERVSEPSDDGEALLSCTSATSTSSTCLAVQPAEALLVLTSGPVEDPLALTARVRDDVVAGDG